MAADLLGPPALSPAFRRPLTYVKADSVTPKYFHFKQLPPKRRDSKRLNAGKTGPVLDETALVSCEITLVSHEIALVSWSSALNYVT